MQGFRLPKRLVEFGLLEAAKKVLQVVEELGTEIRVDTRPCGSRLPGDLGLGCQRNEDHQRP